MNTLSIRSTLVLSMLGVLALAILIIVENSKNFQKEEYYSEKIQAARLTKKYMDHLKARFFANEVAVDNINDPNETGIIGEQFSEITSGRGALPIKLSTTNPNFAAMIIQQIKDAGLEKGDAVGLCFTSSFPALNLATCAAIETLGLQPILISSVTSSSWGANDPNYTWLDMQKSLYNAKLVSFMPVAASIGGNQDIGRTLSREGRRLAENAIHRNGIHYINTGNLKENIMERMSLFQQQEKKPVQLFINVGGGIASLGSNDNAKTIPSGFHSTLKLIDFPDQQGVIYEMVKQDIPIINLLNLSRLMRKYELPRDPVPLPKVGEGILFKAYKYNLTIVVSGTAIFLALIIAVMYYDKKQNKLGTQIINKHE